MSIIDEIADERDRLREEVKRLKAERDQLKAQLEALLITESERLKENAWLRSELEQIQSFKALRKST